jgi:type I restriction enzyme S subunit
VARIRVDERKADRTFVAEYLRLDRTQRYFRTETRAVAQPTLNIKQLSETSILLPPIAIQREFADRAAKVGRLRSVLASHLTTLDALFASLQHLDRAATELEMAG